MISRMLVVSNRLPVVLDKTDGVWRSQPGSGGLVTALAPILHERGGLWIGWPGTSQADEAEVEQALAEASKEAKFDFAGVSLTDEERDQFYYGFSNEIIWPLFHTLHTRCNFEPSYWEAYRAVNRKYAQVVRAKARSDDFVWVHDYHLMHVAQELRQVDLKARIGFFLHIPFPPPEIFLRLPWRFEVLEALLEYDVLGFQTQAYRRNFTQCVNAVMPGMSIRGRGQIMTTRTPKRELRIGVFPISIDFDEFANQAAEAETALLARQIREEYRERTIILGLDRLDYTKGIPERIQAFGQALERYPELRERVVLVQIVIPSRTAIDEYQGLKAEVEKLVSEVNGRYTVPGWVPIHYVFRSLSRTELAAFYRAAHIMLVTPLRDGMNLVAKEYCACRVNNDGVLILSEFAGTASMMLRGALLVNPHDQVGMANAITNAVQMDAADQKRRMITLRNSVRRADVFQWLNQFLAAIYDPQIQASKTCSDHDLLSLLTTAPRTPETPLALPPMESPPALRPADV